MSLHSLSRLSSDLQADRPSRVITLPDFILPRFLFLDYIRNLGSPKFRRWVIDHLPWKNLHILRDIVDAMHGTGEALFQDHLDAFGRGEGEETDILNILSEQIPSCSSFPGIDLRPVKSNNSALKEDRMSDSELLAQITLVYFHAPFTTILIFFKYTQLCRIWHDDRQHNPDSGSPLQTPGRPGRVATGSDQHCGEVSGWRYPIRRARLAPFPRRSDQRNVASLYPTPTHSEAVRSPLSILAHISDFHSHRVNQDTVLPLSRSYPATNGALMTEIFVPRGTMFVLSLNACNRDYAIWGDDARVWKPERWLSPLPDTVIAAKIPGVFSHL